MEKMNKDRSEDMKNMSPKFYDMLDRVNRAEHLDFYELQNLDRELKAYAENSEDCKRDQYQRIRVGRMRERVRDEMAVAVFKIP